MGVKYPTENNTTFRIRDPIKQLDFIYSTKNSSVCGGGNLTTYHPVLGMDRVVIAVRETAKATDRVEMRSVNADAVTKKALSELTRTEIEYASHTQYIRDFAMDISNHLAREIRNLQCESRKTACHIRDGLHAMWSLASVGQPNHQRRRLGTHEIFRVLLARKLRQLQRQSPHLQE